MRLRDLHLKLKAISLGRFSLGNERRRSRRRSSSNSRRKPSWMTAVSHGYHVVENPSFGRGDSLDHQFDSVVVQREQVEQLELWVFGVFDAQVGDLVTKYLQSHLFDRNPKESQIRRKGKEAMRKAFLGARAKTRERQKPDDYHPKRQVGSASVMVINGEKIVMGNMGDYRAVVCRDGMAFQMGSKHRQEHKRHWTRRFFPVPKAMLARESAAGGKGSEIVVGAERIDSDTEFVIIASSGIWEVMKNQEAVSLTRHIENPQQAAECLAKEALIRLSKGSISCVVIRFD